MKKTLLLLTLSLLAVGYSNEIEPFQNQETTSSPDIEKGKLKTFFDFQYPYKNMDFRVNANKMRMDRLYYYFDLNADEVNRILKLGVPLDGRFTDNEYLIDSQKFNRVGDRPIEQVTIKTFQKGKVQQAETINVWCVKEAGNRQNNALSKIFAPHPEAKTYRIALCNYSKEPDADFYLFGNIVETATCNISYQ